MEFGLRSHLWFELTSVWMSDWESVWLLESVTERALRTVDLAYDLQVEGSPKKQPWKLACNVQVSVSTVGAVLEMKINIHNCTHFNIFI